MDYVIRIRKIDFIICKSCQYAIFPSGLESHFRKSSHQLAKQIRKDIIKNVQQWSNLILINKEISIEIAKVLTITPKIFSELTLYHNDFECSEYQYIVRNRRSIQDHYREFHN